MKEIPLGDGLNAKVDDEDYEWLSGYSWYAYYDPERKMTYAAHDTPSGRRVLMHDAIMGLDSLEDKPMNWGSAAFTTKYTKVHEAFVIYDLRLTIYDLFFSSA